MAGKPDDAFEGFLLKLALQGAEQVKLMNKSGRAMNSRIAGIVRTRAITVKARDYTG